MLPAGVCTRVDLRRFALLPGGRGETGAVQAWQVKCGAAGRNRPQLMWTEASLQVEQATSANTVPATSSSRPSEQRQAGAAQEGATPRATPRRGRIRAAVARATRGSAMFTALQRCCCGRAAGLAAATLLYTVSLGIARQSSSVTSSSGNSLENAHNYSHKYLLKKNYFLTPVSIVFVHYIISLVLTEYYMAPGGDVAAGRADTAGGEVR